MFPHRTKGHLLHVRDGISLLFQRLPSRSGSFPRTLSLLRANTGTDLVACSLSTGIGDVESCPRLPTAPESHPARQDGLGAGRCPLRTAGGLSGRPAPGCPAEIPGFTQLPLNTSHSHAGLQPSCQWLLGPRPWDALGLTRCPCLSGPGDGRLCPMGQTSDHGDNFLRFCSHPSPTEGLSSKVVSRGLSEVTSVPVAGAPPWPCSLWPSRLLPGFVPLDGPLSAFVPAYALCGTQI